MQNERVLAGAAVCARVIETVTRKMANTAYILLLLLVAYSVYDTHKIFDASRNAAILKYKPITGDGDVSGEPLVIPNAVAWVTLDDTPIDFPIMQGDDNYKYLNADPFGNFYLGGSIFLDYRNASDFTDDYNLVYGHHMDYDAMFGALDHFKDKAYFDEHRTGTLVVKDVTYDIEIFAVKDCVAYDGNVFDPTRPAHTIGENEAMHYREPASDGRLLVLTTCGATPSDARLAVYGVMTERQRMSPRAE